MPTIPVNNTGAVMYFHDTGPPKNCTVYVTMVLIHGHMFHGASFFSIFPFAEKYKLRMIAPNLRDYPKSTPYAPEEIDGLMSPDIEQQKAAVRMQGLELAAFLKHLVVKENLYFTQDKSGRKSGGIVLLAWSAGNTSPLSMFANTSFFDDETRSVLQRSLRTYVSHVPPHYSFGTPQSGLYMPLTDLTIPADQRGPVFGRWVAYFFDPLPELTDDFSVLHQRAPSTDPTRCCTMDRFTPAEFAAVADPTVLQRSPRLLDVTDRMVYYDNADRALFDCVADDPLCDVDAVVVWADQDPSIGLFNAYQIQKRSQEAASAGKNVRKLKFVKLEAANHFLHYEEPERFLRSILENVL